MPYDFKRAECYYIGDPIQMAFCFSHYEQLDSNYGWQAIISICAEPGFRFNKRILRNGLAFFFKNPKMNNIRLQALTPSWNKQALRLVDIAGFTREGILRKYLRNGDVVISSMLLEEFDKKYGHIQQT